MIYSLPAINLEPSTVEEEIEFTSDKTDEYFGVVSTSGNYPLPEAERVFSNSGWSIDSEGVYLSPSNTFDKLLLLSHQMLVSNISKVAYDLYIPGSDVIVNLWSPIPNQQSTNSFRYSIYVRRSEIRDYSSGAQQKYIITSFSINLSSYNRLRYEFDLAGEKFQIYEANSDYSVFNLLATLVLPVIHTGFYIPGFSGISTNVNNRLKRVTIERYV